VTAPGPHSDEGGPEEADKGGRSGAGDALEDGRGDDPGLRGWVPPEDRLWRHPSETRRPAGRRDDPAGPVPGPPPTHHRVWQSAVIGTAAAAAVIGGVLLLFSTDSHNGSPQLASGQPTGTTTASATTGLETGVPSVVRPVARSMVALQITTATGTSWGCAVAVVAGGLVATTADAVAGATAVTAVTMGGTRERASVVGVDPTSDVALLRVPVDLPVAPFSDDTSLRSGHPAMVMTSSSTGAASARWSATTVETVAAPLVPGDPAGMAGIVTSLSPAARWNGDALVEPGGSVLGILDRDAPTSGATDEVFLPAQLVVGVSGALATNGHVRHGWLDVTFRDVAPSASTGATSTTLTDSTVSSTTDPTSWGGGAAVVTVDARGPSARVLAPGDVIEGIDNFPVRSTAELRSRLYVLAAGTPVQLEVRRGTRLEQVEVNLAASP